MLCADKLEAAVARKAARRKAGKGGERAFLAGYDPSRYPRPSVAVDVALLSAGGGDLYSVVVRRGEHPFKGRWSLPGGFVGPKESLDAAAARVLARETGLRGVFLEQLYTFGAPDRDPRTRVISVAYYALVDRARFAAVEAGGREAAVARLVVPWEGETGGPVELLTAGGERAALAFDHADILGMAVKRLRGKLDYTPIGFQLLPATFTLLELQNVHETVLGRPLNKDSFRRRMLASGLLEATGETQKDVDHRPAELYRFARRSAI
jgi:8-oxo-dGTP diphosphatase